MLFVILGLKVLPSLSSFFPPKGWGITFLPGRGHCQSVYPYLPILPAQGSEEEESCASEITTSLSEEVLDIRGADRYQKGTIWMGAERQGDLGECGGQLFNHGLGHEKAVCCVWCAIGFGY